jgi:hypothetical protein
MIYEGEVGVFLFLFHSAADAPSDADYWYESLAEAESHAAELGVTPDSWQTIADPLSDAQDDRLP